MTENTLKITFGEADELRAAARERVRRAEDGASGEAIQQDVRFVLDVERLADVERLMRSSNLELIRAIVETDPEPIREAADAVDCDYKEVHRNLTEPASLGVVEFVEDGASKAPILRGGAENVDLSFRFPPEADGESAGLSA
jgi:predicted transcriptional regulator